jgi:hypothetical protein
MGRNASVDNEDTRRDEMRKLAVLVLLAVIGVVGPLAGTAHADQASEEAAFVAKINDLRASKGLGQLSVDGNLTSIARDWSAKMANDGGISHNPVLKDLVTGNWSKLGENVGMGPAIDSLFTAFVNSPHHYANLVDPAFTHVGVGVVWRGSTMYTSHEFMTLRGGAPAPAPRATAPPNTTPVTRRAATPRPTVITVPRPMTTTTTTTAPPPPPPTPPPAVPDRVRLSMENLRKLDPSRR